jgi:hypothetical protein
MQGQQGELSVTYRMTCKGENPFTTMRRFSMAIIDLVRRHGGVDVVLVNKEFIKCEADGLQRHVTKPPSEPPLTSQSSPPTPGATHRPRSTSEVTSPSSGGD